MLDELCCSAAAAGGAGAAIAGAMVVVCSKAVPRRMRQNVGCILGQSLLSFLLLPQPAVGALQQGFRCLQQGFLCSQAGVDHVCAVRCCGNSSRLCVFAVLCCLCCRPVDCAVAVPALLHTPDSWGSTSPIYDFQASKLDSWLYKNQDCISHFAAGNYGENDNLDSTITSPATAKNAVTVGATKTAAPNYISQTIAPVFMMSVEIKRPNKPAQYLGMRLVKAGACCTPPNASRPLLHVCGASGMGNQACSCYWCSMPVQFAEVHAPV